MTSATEQQRKSLVEGLPTLLLTLKVGNGASQRSEITIANGDSTNTIDRCYVGAAICDAIQAIIKDRTSYGRKYTITIQGAHQ